MSELLLLHGNIVVPTLRAAGAGGAPSYETYAGLLAYDFATDFNAGAFENQTDPYGFTLNHEDGAVAEAANNACTLEANDAVQMLHHKQQNASGANKNYFINEGGSVKTDWLTGDRDFKFRWLVDVPGTDTGHSLRLVMSDAVAGHYNIVKILGNGIIQWQVDSNTRVNQSGLTPGNLTVMGYYRDSDNYFFLKAKNGHDAAMSWTTWDGSDANAFGSYDEGDVEYANAKIGIGGGNDTSPLTHGYSKTFEFMTDEYSGWAT
jgi:hypothetical protein